jgi:hypothetical protein
LPPHGSGIDYIKRRAYWRLIVSRATAAPTLTGFEFVAEGVASRSRTNSLSSMLRETSPSAARKGAATTFIGASAASAQQPADRRERQNDGRNSEANPQEAHRSLHRRRDEDVPPTKTAGRRDDREARGFPNRGRALRSTCRSPRGRSARRSPLPRAQRMIGDDLDALACGGPNGLSRDARFKPRAVASERHDVQRVAPRAFR